MQKLSRFFYDRDAETVARELLGKYLVHTTNGKRRMGKIVETEAYLGPHDLAAHSAKGRTKRTEVMFGPPGHAYVYLIYGMHWCFNVVTEQEGAASAVLIRALEPVEGITDRTNGPGLLCRAMNITGAQNSHDLLNDTLYIADPDETESITIIARPRIGVDYAGEWAKRLLRFYVKGNRYVSRS